jgi:Na+/melibiose symporter-like transporter
MPQNFPYHGQSNDRTKKNAFGKETFQRVDLVGATLLLLATLSLTAGFEEAGSQFYWGSAYVIALLIVSGVLWICLLLWERRLTLQDTTVEPVFPWRFVKNRQMLSLML